MAGFAVAREPVRDVYFDELLEDGLLGLRLTQRQAEVYKLLAEGLTEKEVANELGVSAKTVNAHKTAVQSKTGAKNTTHVLMMALRSVVG